MKSYSKTGTVIEVIILAAVLGGLGYGAWWVFAHLLLPIFSLVVSIVLIFIAISFLIFAIYQCIPGKKWEETS